MYNKQGYRQFSTPCLFNVLCNYRCIVVQCIILLEKYVFLMIRIMYASEFYIISVFQQKYMQRVYNCSFVFTCAVLIIIFTAVIVYYFYLLGNFTTIYYYTSDQVKTAELYNVNNRLEKPTILFFPPRLLLRFLKVDPFSRSSIHYFLTSQPSGRFLALSVLHSSSLQPVETDRNSNVNFKYFRNFKVQ